MKLYLRWFFMSAILWALIIGLYLAGTSFGADISGPSTFEACPNPPQLIRLSTTVEEGHTVKWTFVSPRGYDHQLYNNGQSVSFPSPCKSQLITVLLIDTWVDEDGTFIQENYHDVVIGDFKPDKPDNPDPVDPIDPVDPDPVDPLDPEIPEVPEGLNGIARVAFVESRKIQSYTNKVENLADAYGSIASSIVAGGLHGFEEIELAIRAATKDALGEDLEKWDDWTKEIENKFRELNSVDVMTTDKDIAEQCRNVEEGLRGVPTTSESAASVNSSTETPYASKGGQLQSFAADSKPFVEEPSITEPTITEDGTADERFKVTKKDGNRYVTDAKTNLTYLVDEVTSTFCIGGICYKVN